MEGNVTENYDHLYQIDHAYPAVAFSSCTFFTFIFFIASPVCSRKVFPAYNSFKGNVKQDWNSRVGAMVHCLIVCPLSTYVILFDEEARSNLVWGNSVIGRVAMAITEGYMLADLWVVLKFFPLKEAVIYSFHHIATLYPYTYGVLYGPLTYFGCFKLMTEGSTPFVNLRWFLSTLKRTDDNLYFYNGIVMTFSFFLLRVVCMVPYWVIIYRTFSTDPMPSITISMKASVILGSAALDILNIYWFHKMIQGGIRVLEKRTLANKRKSEALKAKEL